MLKYLESVFGGILGATLIIILLPLIAIYIVLCGFLGRVRVFDKGSDNKFNLINVKSS